MHTCRKFGPLVAATLLAALATGSLAGPAQASGEHSRADAIVGPSAVDRSSPPASDHATKVTLTPRATHALRAAHISLRATGKASLSTTSTSTTLRFPNTRHHRADNSLTYDGGITFKRGHAHLHLGKFRLHLKPKHKTVSAAIGNDARADMFTVAPNKTGTVDQIFLNKLSAGQLNAIFDTHRFRAGEKFATVRLPQLLGSTTAITLDIRNSTSYELRLVSADTNHIGAVTSTPAKTLAPAGQDGDTDRITYASDNSEGGYLDVKYSIMKTTTDDTDLQFDAQFFVPILNQNTAVCSQRTYIDFSQCSMSHWTYTPEAHWVITQAPDGPFFDLGPSGQQWTFRLQGTGTSSRKYMQIDDSSTDEGTAASLYVLRTGSHYDWTWVPDSAGDGYGELINVNSKMCLERNGVTFSVDQWTCQGSDNQLWKPVWNSNGGSALELKYTHQYLSSVVPPSLVQNDSALILSNDLSPNNSWSATKVRTN
jgi:hypothetical protein